MAASSNCFARGSHPSQPTISVVIPAYNAERWIASTAASVLSQSRPPEEVVIVENGSTDRTFEQLAPFAGRVRVVRMENRGAPAAYARGFAEARGDYVAMCPADDLWRPDKLKWQAEALRQHPEVDIAFGHARHFGADTSEYRRPPGRGVLDHRVFQRAMYAENLIAAPTALIRRALYERIGGFREDILVEDYEFWMRALRAGAVFYYEPRLLVDFRRHGNNLSSRLLEMRRDVAYPVHVEYADDVEPQLSARILAGDLRQLGRYHFDAGHTRPARDAYRESLGYRRSPKATMAFVALSLPGSARPLRRVEAVIRRSGRRP